MNWKCMTEIRTFDSESIHGFLHLPSHPPEDGLVLTHGAGGNCRSPLLIAIANAFAAAGLLVLRFDLPFRRIRSFGPPFPGRSADDRKGLQTAVSELRRQVPGRIFLSGHSYGGRQASILASEDPHVADALLLLSYPLHPPKKPDQLRTAHFPQIVVPSFFIQGKNDPFASVPEMVQAVSLIPAKTELCAIKGAGHELSSGEFDIAGLAVQPFLRLVDAASFYRLDSPPVSP
jgi:hypothetical protein